MNELYNQSELMQSPEINTFHSNLGRTTQALYEFLDKTPEYKSIEQPKQTDDCPNPFQNTGSTPNTIINPSTPTTSVTKSFVPVPPRSNVMSKYGKNQDQL
jgi:hypothetical protein